MPRWTPVAAAVDQPHLSQARFVRGAHVFVDHRCHIARGKGVQIEDGLDRETVGHTALRVLRVLKVLTVLRVLVLRCWRC